MESMKSKVIEAVPQKETTNGNKCKLTPSFWLNAINPPQKALFKFKALLTIT
jgi:hypothetical protein